MNRMTRKNFRARLKRLTRQAEALKRVALDADYDVCDSRVYIALSSVVAGLECASFLDHSEDKR